MLTAFTVALTFLAISNSPLYIDEPWTNMTTDHGWQPQTVSNYSLKGSASLPVNLMVLCQATFQPGKQFSQM